MAAFLTVSHPELEKKPGAGSVGSVGQTETIYGLGSVVAQVCSEALTRPGTRIGGLSKQI